jgi:hypothetical protein
MKVILDSEWEDLDSDKCWCVVFVNIDTGEVSIFEHPYLDPEPLRRFCQRIELVVGHNILKFDLPKLEKVFGITFPLDKVVDTFVVGNLLNFGIEGGHSLEAWGKRLK